MRVSIGVLSTFALLCGVGQLEGQQVRPDSYKWYFGVTGGGLMAQTQTQDYEVYPSVGAHISVMGKLGGVTLSFEESFGDNEQSAFGFVYQQVVGSDTVAAFPIHSATFDRVRKYSATMMAYPLRSRLEPYLGVGFGLMHTVGTQLASEITTPEEGIVADSVLNVRTSTGFGSLVGGLQYGAGSSMVLYGQYQITTSPASGNLLTGPTHAFLFGVRFRLGRAKDDIKGGGY
jgi:hypothetical protein